MKKIFNFSFYFPIPHSPFPISYSSLSIPHSSFLIPHSPFPIPHSPFPIPYSLFPIPHFPIPRFPFFIQGVLVLSLSDLRGMTCMQTYLIFCSPEAIIILWLVRLGHFFFQLVRRWHAWLNISVCLARSLWIMWPSITTLWAALVPSLRVSMRMHEIWAWTLKVRLLENGVIQRV